MGLKLVMLFAFGYITDNSLCKNSIPRYVTLCKQSDPGLDNCISNSIKAMIPYLGKGIPEMRIAPLNPLKVSKLTINGGNNFKIEYSEVEFWNLLTFEIKNLHIDLQTSELDLYIHFPRIEQRSKYNVQGHVLVFDLNSSGYCAINITNNDVNAILKGNTEQTNGSKFLNFTRIDLDMKIDDFMVYFDNMFEGNAELTENFNVVINENSKTLIQEYGSLMSDSLKTIIMTMVKNVFDTFSLEQLLLK